MMDNQEFNKQLRQRTFDVSARIVKVVGSLPNNATGWKIGDQVIRSGTAIGALTEEAVSGVSYKDFIHGMRMSRKEAYETRFWLKLIIKVKLIKEKRLENLLKEIEEIIKILSSIVKTGSKKIK